MVLIKITEERIEKILPKHIKETKLISNEAKKVLAALINYYLNLDIPKKCGYVAISNSTLRESVVINNNELLNYIEELVEYKLIIRERGQQREKGKKAIASKYYILWENLNKPVKELEFEDLYGDFLNKNKEEKPIQIINNTNIVNNENYLIDKIDTVLVNDSMTKNSSEEKLDYFIREIKEKYQKN